MPLSALLVVTYDVAMRIVVVGSDRLLFQKDSAVRARLRAYSAHAHITVFVVAKGKGRGAGENNLAIFPLRLFSLLGIRFWRECIAADVITSQDPFLLGLFSLFVSTLLRKPLHVQIHTDIHSPAFIAQNLKNRAYRFISKIVLPHASRIRVVLQKTKDELIKEGVRVSVTVLPIFVDSTSFAAVTHMPHPTFKPALLSVGRLEQEKRFEESIRAVAFLRAKGHDAGLTIVGEGSERKRLEQCAHDAGVAPSVLFVGAQNDIRPFLSQADVLLVPSSYEGYGMVIVEALSARVPVISTDVGVARDAGAHIALHEAFPEAVVRWVEEDMQPCANMRTPYPDQETYVRAWVEDVAAATEKI